MTTFALDQELPDTAGEEQAPIQDYEGDLLYDRIVLDLPEDLPDLKDLTLEEINHLRERLETATRARQTQRGQIEMELGRRAREAHPDFTEESSGGRDVVGDELILTMTWDRTYEWVEDALIELSTKLTADEYGKLVKWEPKGNGTVYNQLIKRDDVADLLRRARILKSARPKFEFKARK
jgi:hypothetical protein